MPAPPYKSILILGDSDRLEHDLIQELSKRHPQTRLYVLSLSHQSHLFENDDLVDAVLMVDPIWSLIDIEQALEQSDADLVMACFDTTASSSYATATLQTDAIHVLVQGLQQHPTVVTVLINTTKDSAGIASTIQKEKDFVQTVVLQKHLLHANSCTAWDAIAHRVWKVLVPPSSQGTVVPRIVETLYHKNHPVMVGKTTHWKGSTES
jgi:hypothetical protein